MRVVLVRSMLLLAVLTTIASGCIFFTETGIELVRRVVNHVSGPAFFVGRLEGRLLGQWRAYDIRLVTPEVECTVRQLEWAWRLRSLLSGQLQIAEVESSGVDIVIKDAASDTASADQLRLPAVILPFGFVLSRLDITDLRLLDQDHEELLAFNTIVASLAVDSSMLIINDFLVDGEDLGLTLHGSVDMRRDWALDALGTFRVAGYGFHPLKGTFAARGPLETVHLDLGVNTPAAIRVSGDFSDLLNNPQWSATLDSGIVDLEALIIDCPQIILQQVHGDLTGDFLHYRGEVTAEGKWGEMDGLQLVTDIDGYDLGIDFKTLRIDREDGHVVAKGGKISWRHLFSWESDLSVVNFDLSKLGVDVTGKLSSEFSSMGEVLDDGLAASFIIPQLSGIIQQQPVSARGRLVLTENGVQTDGLMVQSSKAEGLVDIHRAELSWEDLLRWSGTLSLQAFDPGFFHSALSGSVNGEIDVEGRQEKNGLQGFVRIGEITGDLHGHELSGGGEVRLSENVISSPGLSLQSGSTQINIKGSAGDLLGLDFSVVSGDIGSVLKAASGDMKLAGTLTGSRSLPSIRAELEGNELRYEDYSLGHIEVTAQGALHTGGTLAVSGRVESMEADGFSVDDGSFDLHGSCTQHSLELQADTSAGSISLQARGGYDTAWSGHLLGLTLENSEYGTWRQSGEANLAAGRTAVSVSDLCVGEQDDSLCLSGDIELEDMNNWKLAFVGKSLPLSWLSRFEYTGPPLTGLVEAKINAAGNRMGVHSGLAQVEAPEVKFPVQMEGLEMVDFTFQESGFTAELIDGRLTANFTTSVDNFGSAGLNVALLDAGNFGTSLLSLPLTGDLHLHDFDIAMLSGFTGYWVEPTGHLDGVLTLGGTVSRPNVTGDISVLGGGLTLPYQGVSLSDIKINLQAGVDGMVVAGQASSGPGKVTAKGRLNFDSEKGIAGDLHLQGKDFLLVELPEYVFRVAPDVHFIFDRESATVAGNVVVPYGSIAPEEFKDAIKASEDVIVVNGNSEEKKNGLPIVLDLGVKLGDDVRIDGYGLSGRLGGSMLIKTTSSDLLTGRGELDLIEGVFTLYGRTLDIERGRILFTGGPIDNPGVDVRAQKKVSDEAAKGQGYTVGVDISGLVQDLQFQLFSDPYMEDTEILSLMIVGHSLANTSSSEGSLLQSAAESLGMSGGSKIFESLGDVLKLDDLHLEGSGKDEDVSLVVGKKITDDLYIGYDVNMFSQLGQFRVRYDLTHGFWVETRSSSESTGADLLYSFER